MVLEHDPESEHEDDSQERYLRGFFDIIPVFVIALALFVWVFLDVIEWATGYNPDISKIALAHWELALYLLALERIRPVFVPLDDIGIND